MLEWLFKYPAPVFRNGDIVLLAGWPLWVLGAAVAAAGLLWAAQLFRATSAKLGTGRLVVLWMLQTALAALVLLLLWRPAVQISTSRPQQNVVAILADTSRSMALEDPGAGVRIEAVRRVLGETLLPGLQPRFRVRLYGFSDRPAPVETIDAFTAKGGATRLGESLASVLRESRVLPLAAVVVFSDGADNKNASTAALLEEITQAGVPVHTVGVGRAALAKDVELEDAVVPPRAPSGARLRVQVRLRQTGLGGRRARLTIHERGTALAARDVVFTRGQERQTEEVYLPAGAAGAKALTIAVDPLDGEEVTANNRVVRPLQVVSRRARVLYVEGEPRWELKFIRRAVEHDETLQLVSLLRTSANKVYRQGVDDETTLAAGFPSKAEELFAFDALMIGSVEAAYFTPAQQMLIRDFAGRRGGSLLWLGGRRALGDGGWAASAAADVLPVRLQARTPAFERVLAKAELAPEGRDSLLTLLDEDAARNLAKWTALPELADHQRTGELKPGAAVLLHAVLPGPRSIPLLAAQSYGRGQAVVFATGGSWRWRMRSAHEDTSHATFWRQLLRGLVSRAAGPLVVSTDRSLYADDDRVAVRAEVRTKAYEPVSDARVWATVAAEDGTRETFELAPSAAQRGLYEGRVAARRTGLHRIEVHGRRGDDDLGRETTVVYREDGVAEDFHPQQNADLLRRIARDAGGRYWTLDEAAGLPSEIAYSGAGITVRETLDLWDMPAIFLAALLLRAGEWLVRRGGGRI
jgi:uncharacterized membrane protein